MKRGLITLAVVTLLLGGARLHAQSKTDPLSALPLPPGFTRTGDPEQPYSYCGKRASVVMYTGEIRNLLPTQT